MAAMNMNQEQFEQAIREKKPVLVDFWAPWCSYCRRIGPAYEKIGEEYADSLAVGKINIDEEPRLAGAEGIEDIPTLVLYRNGKAVDSITALGSKAEIDRFIQDLSTGKATQSPPTDSHGLDVVYHEPAEMSNVFRSERRTASIMTSLTVEAVAGCSFGLRCFHQNCRVQMS